MPQPSHQKLDYIVITIMIAQPIQKICEKNHIPKKYAVDNNI